jgi:hypothetical protein
MDLREWNLVAQGDFFRRHPWEIARLWSLIHFLRQNGYSSESKFSVLDFGGGDLFVALGVKHFFPNAQITSIDSAYSPDLISSLKASAQMRQLTAYRSLDEWKPESGGRADVVLLLDVLEHCENDQAILKMLRASGKVSHGALWVITVPAFQSLFTRYDQFLGHFRRYGFGQLRGAVENSGLDVKAGGYFFGSLILPRMLQKGLELIGLGKQKPKGLAGYRPIPFVGKAIASILYSDFYLLTLLNRLGIRLPGLSCYALARASH